MTPSASTPEFTRDTGGIMNRLRRIEAWMDAHGRKTWIAAMILGFIFVWPVGLALLAYITFTNRWSRSMFASRPCMSRHDRMAMNQRWDWRLWPESCFSQPSIVLLRTVSPAFGERKQGGRVQRDRQRTVQFVTEQHVMDDQPPAGIQRFDAALDQRLTFGNVPVVKNIGQQDDVGGRQRIGKHITRLRLQAISNAVVIRKAFRRL